MYFWERWGMVVLMSEGEFLTNQTMGTMCS